MIIDARTLPSGKALTAEICIIGAGAAGITIALALADLGLRIVLLEGGGRRFEASSQALYGGEVVGLDYDLLNTRTRFLGGSTNCWSGFSRPFEDYHFIERPWIPHSGWPLSRADLDPYYNRALDLFGLDQTLYDPQLQPGMARWAGLGVERQAEHAGLVTSIALLNRHRRRFGTVHRQSLAASRDVQLLLHANVTRLNLAESAAIVRSVSVACLNGVTFSVEAGIVVLAAGGIENPRLLLLSNDVQAAGLGNGYDVVGRYFQEHPTFTVASARFTDRTFPAQLYDTLHILSKLYSRSPFGISAEFNVGFARQSRERILDSTLYVSPHYRAEDSPGVDVLKTARKLTRRGVGQYLRKDGWQLVRHLPSVVTFGIGHLTQWPMLIKDYEIVATMEAAPNPDSRVLLSDQRDHLGLNKVRLDWRMTELDRYSLERTAAIMTEDLTQRGVGLVGPVQRPKPRENDPDWIRHHMGTTRMHPDPKQGVVDADCRVHGIGNLFIAGSSVFPTGGNHTPTLTLVALAFRLADHLVERLRRPESVVIFSSVDPIYRSKKPGPSMQRE